MEGIKKDKILLSKIRCCIEGQGMRNVKAQYILIRESLSTAVIQSIKAAVEFNGTRYMPMIS